MKNLILILTLFFVTNVEAMPEYLKGATITVELSNGEKHSFKSEEYKVVPRLNKELSSGNTVSPIALKKHNRHRVYMALGKGFNGLSLETEGSTHRVSNNNGFTYGLGYSYSLTERYNLGVLGLNNGTLLVTGGIDFK